jgi:hypothetical protein
MRSVDEVLAALSCPLGHEQQIEALLAMTDEECACALGNWSTQVFGLNPHLQFELVQKDAQPTQVWSSISIGDFKGYLVFRVFSGDALIAVADDVTLGSLRLDEADVTVVALRGDPQLEPTQKAIETIQKKAGAPVPTFVVMDPAWLAAAVVGLSKPFAYSALTQNGRHLPPEPYFTEGQDGAKVATEVTRSGGSLRAAMGAWTIAEEPSLPEKFRAESSHSPAPTADLTIVTTFLPPVTHSRAALTRYYSRDGVDHDLVEDLVAARQDAESSAWRRQLENHKLRLIVDRQQLEEYFADPEYYQMILTPDELDEQVAAWTGWFSSPALEIALSPEPIDIPFMLQGDTVTIRGDRRNRSEPRPGRLSGMRLKDKKIAEEFRRESWSLLQLTESHFQDKAFVRPWAESLTRRYRTKYRRSH